MQNAIAVISDIHSNFEALTAVLDDVRLQEVQQVVCLGDIVGYASSVQSCMRAVRELGCPVLMGNHDEAACLPAPPKDFNDTATAGVVFASARLSESDRAWITCLPRNLEIDGVVFTHASLANSFGWPYIISPEDARRHFANQTTHLAFCGHTHKPMVWLQESPGGQVTQRTGKEVMPLPPGGKVLVNVGAVGQPRDGDTRACYVIYRLEQATVEFRRVEYDIKRTKRKIIRAGLPRFTAQRLSLGR
ncbi:MAG: metallophosphoesterase family protein [Verrucomicrobia bacterium]|nr:metallophosphoesterase family protein [Verrucomicrobiota bacterium]